jgi:DNA-binding transcriptional LysR family regulator
MWESVELRDVRVFLTLCDELHFAKAAERLRLSPSRVSQTVRTLERRIGGPLFDRTSRSVRLTPLGEQLRHAIGPAYAQLARGFEMTRETAVGLGGEVRIGMYTPLNGGPHLVEIVRLFQARHPGCRVTLVDTGFARDQFDWLRHGDVDLLAMRLPFSEPDVTIGPILSCEERVVAVSVGHRLASRAWVTLEDLIGCTLPEVPALPAQLMEEFVPGKTPSGHIFPRTRLRSISEAIMRVGMGEIVHPTVRSFIDYHQHPDVVAVPLRGLPPSRTALVWLTASRDHRIEAFVESAVEALTAAGHDTGTGA